jgi:predicted GIY-YIG superfamily endonuclease
MPKQWRVGDKAAGIGPETPLKRSYRQRKFDLVERGNSDWQDMSGSLL